MSHLPYRDDAPFGWLAAGAGSVALHGGLVALLAFGLPDLFADRDVTEDRSTVRITIDALDTEALVGLLPEASAPPEDVGLIEDAPRIATADSDVAEALAADPVAPSRTAEAAEPEPVAPPETADIAEATPVSPEAAPEIPADILAGRDAASEARAERPPRLPRPADEGLAAAVPSATLEAITPIEETGVITGPAPGGGGAAPGDPAPAARAPQPGIARGPDAPPTANAPPAPVAGSLSGTAQVAALAREPAEPRPVEGRDAAPAAPAARRPRSAAEVAVGELILRIRAETADACLLALPRRDGADGIGLALFAAADAAMEDFSASVLDGSERADIRQTRTLVDPRQCAALTYVRLNRDYPATRIGIALDSRDVPSGGRLTGVLRANPDRNATLLLVDNNGVVQDLGRFLSYSGDLARFDVPVTRVGPRRDTAHLLIAIAADGPLTPLTDRAGQLAEAVFSGLDGALDGQAALGVVSFEVR